MAEETQVLSIQDRIKALKQAQAGQSTEAGTGSPLLGSQPTAFALRPGPPRTNSINAIQNGNTPPVPTRPLPGNNNAPPQISQKKTPPLPSRGRTPTTEQASAAPPPLPARKASTQLVPSLPSRRPSVDSTSSDVSRSTSTSAGTLPVLRAPAWGAGELPPLPPKRQDTKPVTPPTRPKPTTSTSNGSISAPRPTLPPRQSSNQSITTNSSRSQSRPPPPRLPSRDIRDRSPAARDEVSSRPPPKRLPPPTLSNDALGKIQKSGFSATKPQNTVNGTNGVSQDKIPNDVSPAPPPIPLASRPDLSQIQATKPRLDVPRQPTPAQSSGCLKCRDFSGPDTHASRYPRETLPTQDLGWLARELTAPFLSSTDKARAIFTWLHHNIAYDVVAFFSGERQSNTAESTFSRGLSVCEGYSNLFAELATRAGLEAIKVSGHGKGFGYDAPPPGSSLPPFSVGHAWNAVRIDNGHWKLVDACWGAGSVSGAGQPYSKHFTPAHFTKSNDEFGLEHFPTDRNHFFRDDGRPEISWEEYILGNPNSPLGAEMPKIYSSTHKYSIGDMSIRPTGKQIAIRQTGSLRFQFNLACEHFSLERHCRKKPALFALITHGVDGRKKDWLVLTRFRGTGPNGGGDVWYVDVPDARMLGAPGQKVQLVALTKFGDREEEECLGVTAEEYKRGGKATSWSFLAEWGLVV